MSDAEAIIHAHRLRPHPEGGWYRQTWIADAPEGERPAATAILFLLRAGERSRWHRVDAAEIWHFHAGAPLRLLVAPGERGPARPHVLGPDPLIHAPQAIVPAHHWQAAESTGAWSLVGCTVSPAFRFEGFELAPADFDIPAEAS